MEGPHRYRGINLLLQLWGTPNPVFGDRILLRPRATMLLYATHGTAAGHGNPRSVRDPTLPEQSVFISEIRG